MALVAQVCGEIDSSQKLVKECDELFKFCGNGNLAHRSNKLLDEANTHCQEIEKFQTDMQRMRDRILCNLRKTRLLMPDIAIDGKAHDFVAPRILNATLCHTFFYPEQPVKQEVKVDIDPSSPPQAPPPPAPVQQPKKYSTVPLEWLGELQENLKLRRERLVLLRESWEKLKNYYLQRTIDVRNYMPDSMYEDNAQPTFSVMNGNVVDEYSQAYYPKYEKAQQRVVPPTSRQHHHKAVEKQLSVNNERELMPLMDMIDNLSDDEETKEEKQIKQESMDFVTTK